MSEQWLCASLQKLELPTIMGNAMCCVHSCDAVIDREASERIGHLHTPLLDRQEHRSAFWPGAFRGVY